MEEYKKIDKVVGYDLDISTGAGSAATDVTPVQSDGDIIGISINQAYDMSDMAQLLITIEQGDSKPVKNAASDMLVMNGNRPYWNVENKLVPGVKITVTLESRSANTDSGTQPVLMFHHGKRTCPNQ